MADTKKQRMSMLDNLAQTGLPPVTASMMATNRALRSAREAVDSHHVWELDPDMVEDQRQADRLDPQDVQDLRASIEQNGQAVPILVRRHPTDPARYLLVYGRRRLEAIRASDRVDKVRALIAVLDEPAALRAQVAENTGRRDLSYIERAIFACELMDSGHGSQAQVAEILAMSRPAMSMAVAVARAIGPDLARAIGPAQGIGRPRWEALARDIAAAGQGAGALVTVAQKARAAAAAVPVTDDPAGPDPSLAAFDAVARHLKRALASKDVGPTPAPPEQTITIDGRKAATLRRTAGALRLDIKDGDGAFAQWLERRAQDIITELHARWKRDA